MPPNSKPQERLPELAKLVNARDWTFTRNLIHGPMQEVGRGMLYINQRLLPGDRAEANKLATSLKEGLADLDEAARLQDGARLQKAYVEVATGFANYARMIPEQALNRRRPPERLHRDHRCWRHWCRHRLDPGSPGTPCGSGGSRTGPNARATSQDNTDWHVSVAWNPDGPCVPPLQRQSLAAAATQHGALAPVG